MSRVQCSHSASSNSKHARHICGSGRKRCRDGGRNDGDGTAARDGCAVRPRTRDAFEHLTRMYSQSPQPTGCAYHTYARISPRFARCLHPRNNRTAVPSIWTVARYLLLAYVNRCELIKLCNKYYETARLLLAIVTDRRIQQTEILIVDDVRWCYGLRSFCYKCFSLKLIGKYDPAEGYETNGTCR